MLVVLAVICYTDRMKMLMLFLIILTSCFVQAKALQKTLEKYAKTSSIQFDIKKTEEKMILGTKNESKGILKYQKNKIAIAFAGERKTDFFYSDKVLTLVEYPDPEFGPSGKRKVSVFKKIVRPEIKSLLNLFSNPKNFNKEFSVISQSESENTYSATLKAAQKNIKKFSLKINLQDLSLKEVSFVDDLDTKTTIEFSNQKLNEKMSKSDFQYKPLTTDEVMTE
jgi:outer membrane lipoprotein-sorting protein